MRSDDPGGVFLSSPGLERLSEFVERCPPKLPGEVTRFDLLRRVHEHVERGARLLIAYTATLTDAKLIADLRHGVSQAFTTFRTSEVGPVRVARTTSTEHSSTLNSPAPHCHYEISIDKLSHSSQ